MSLQLFLMLGTVNQELRESYLSTTSHVLLSVTNRGITSHRALQAPVKASNMTIATVTVTAGALRNHHFHLTTVMDMFPSDAMGGKNRNFEAPRLLRVDFGGNLIANTDIDGDKNFFRDRRVQRLFFERNAVKAGDKLIVERNGRYEFSVRKAI